MRVVRENYPQSAFTVVKDSLVERCWKIILLKCTFCGEDSKVATYYILYESAVIRDTAYLCSGCVVTAENALSLAKEATQEWKNGNHRMYVLIEQRDEQQQLDETVSVRKWTPEGLKEIA